jgi:two-component system NarL family response regulator
MTSKNIGDVLFISENTVKNHVRNVLDKLGLHSRNEAVLYAIRENLIAL